MTLAELTRRWEARRDEWARLGVSIDGGKVADEILRDLEQLGHEDDAPLTIPAASNVSGYSPDHLRHLVAKGTIQNVGRKHAPRVRRADLPRKSGVVAGNSTYTPDADALSLVRRPRPA